MHVKAGDITSSPGEIPPAKRAECNVDVPELKEEFNVVNPVEAAKQKIMDDARDDREFVEEQNRIRDVQSSYLQYMMGNG